MKKYLLGFILSAGLCITAGAQSKFSIGPNAGVGASWISGFNNSKAKLAGNVGLSLMYSATEHFGIGLDGKYSFEGVKQEIGANTNTLDLNYIRVPLKAVYFFNNYGDRLRPKVGLGASFGFLTRAKVNNVVQKDVYDNFDFGVVALAGINYRLVRNTWFNADVNYLHGVTEIINNSDWRNRNVQLNVGVNFGL